jgi:hypothetical protein
MWDRKNFLSRCESAVSAPLNECAQYFVAGNLCFHVKITSAHIQILGILDVRRDWFPIKWSVYQKLGQNYGY